MASRIWCMSAYPQVYVDGEIMADSPFLVGVQPPACPHSGQQPSPQGVCFCAAPCAPHHPAHASPARAAPGVAASHGNRGASVQNTHVNNLFYPGSPGTRRTSRTLSDGSCALPAELPVGLIVGVTVRGAKSACCGGQIPVSSPRQLAADTTLGTTATAPPGARGITHAPHLLPPPLLRPARRSAAPPSSSWPPWARACTSRTSGSTACGSSLRRRSTSRGARSLASGAEGGG